MKSILVLIAVLVSTSAFATGTKISLMPTATSVGSTDIVPIVQGGVNKGAAASLVTGALNATDLLTKIKTVDGAGSGLDADLLDGISSSGFATAAQGAKADAAQPAATAITTSNIGSQSVAYATSASSATTATSASTATTATTATDSSKLNGQPASYYQPASTAITTSNVGGQSVLYASGAGTATTAANYSGSGNLPITRSENGLRIIRGNVSSSGTVTSGSGFTIADHPAAGNFYITFANAFSGVPTVTCTATGGLIQAGTPTTSDITLGTLTYAGALADKAFSFIAIGPN